MYYKTAKPKGTH